MLLVSAIGAFLLVRYVGDDLQPPVEAPVSVVNLTAATPNVLPRVLLTLVVVLLASRIVGWLAARLGQPPVIGEVIAGIALGPSLLGRFAPDASAYLFASFVTQPLYTLAQVGVVLFLFLVGLELDTRLLKTQSHQSVVISHASIVVPFMLGSVTALWVYPRFSLRNVPFDVFAMFMGVSMSVTAFPVLARILTDRGITRTNIGVITLACAAVDDVTAWCLLAMIVGFASGDASGALPTLGLTCAYLVAMLFVVRPLITRVANKLEPMLRLSKGTVATVLVCLLLSALLTEAIGVHALFGAFALGAIIPHESRLARDLASKLEDVTVLLFLPTYFAYTGLRTEIGLVEGAQQWLVCGGLVLVATAGKFGGSAVAGRLVGLSWDDASRVGVLMNTRGLMELVVLNLGLDLGVLSPQLFTMLVIMAVVTTMMTGPGLSLLDRHARLRVVRDTPRLADRADA
ncbi:MAG: cation:proton antiporter [Deltaproteobacteria bacterium]|nr:cation:proton antiporter [Deltaproteobacteria bacterium]